MIQHILILVITSSYLKASPLYEDVEPKSNKMVSEEVEFEPLNPSSRSSSAVPEDVDFQPTNPQPRSSSTVPEEVEFEPINPLTKDNERMLLEKNINCDDFSGYALNCHLEAALQYNSSRKSPPMPAKITDWCKAVRHLTNCGIEWNTECKEVTETVFNEDSIKGHMHVVDNVCDDEWFLSRYDDLPLCIEVTGDGWEACYSAFKLIVDEQKNKTGEYTHYQKHFVMCCARAQFRRCTLDGLFGTEKCTHDQASTLQKFSVIVSEGDVFQDCDSNMMYNNCPDGDPRPSKSHLRYLIDSKKKNAAHKFRLKLRYYFSILLLYFGFYNYFV